MRAAIGIFYGIMMIVLANVLNVSIRKGVREGRIPEKKTRPVAVKPVQPVRAPRSRSSKPASRLSGRERSGKLVDSPVLLEDREHDWLAKQLREEAKLMRRGDMLDLGANHGKSCDARRIRAYHILEHDDSIDNGEI